MNRSHVLDVVDTIGVIISGLELRVGLGGGGGRSRCCLVVSVCCNVVAQHCKTLYKNTLHIAPNKKKE